MSDGQRLADRLSLGEDMKKSIIAVALLATVAAVAAARRKLKQSEQTAARNRRSR
jgi:hypothetical protein